MAQLVECQSLQLEIVSSRPTRYKLFPHVCAYFGICSLHGIILPRLQLRGQLQYRTTLIKTYMWSKFDVLYINGNKVIQVLVMLLVRF